MHAVVLSGLRGLALEDRQLFARQLLVGQVDLSLRNALQPAVEPAQGLLADERRIFVGCGDHDVVEPVARAVGSIELPDDRFELLETLCGKQQVLGAVHIRRGRGEISAP